MTLSIVGLGRKKYIETSTLETRTQKRNETAEKNVVKDIAHNHIKIAKYLRQTNVWISTKSDFS